MAGNPRIHGPRALRIIGRVFLGLGLICFLSAAALAVVELHGGRSGSADGTITGFNGGPMVQFTTPDGAVVRFGSAIRSSFRHVGDHVPVAFRPERPDDARIDGFAGRWFPAGLFGILAAAFLLVGGGLTVAGQRVADRSAGRYA
jgi:Protein of unknown function (DUF3592)